MTKVYKNAEEFLRENFPESYLVYKNDEETSLQYYIETSAERFNKTIKEILKGTHPTPHNNKSVSAPMP
jgi:uncharacterized phage-like protein YoqJ